MPIRIDNFKGAVEMRVIMCETCFEHLSLALGTDPVEIRVKRQIDFEKLHELCDRS